MHIFQLVKCGRRPDYFHCPPRIQLREFDNFKSNGIFNSASLYKLVENYFKLGHLRASPHDHDKYPC